MLLRTTERVIFRELFPHGLTAFDDLDEAVLGGKPNLSHRAARDEVRRLIEALKLPIDDRGRRRAAARAVWASSQDTPLEIDELIDLGPMAIAPPVGDATL